MFGKLEDIVDKALKLDDKAVWFQVVDKEIQYEIVRLNTIEQLYKEGERSDGTILPDYSETSVNVYGKPRGHIRLKETGGFYRSFIVKVDAKGYEVIADTDVGDSIQEDLAVRYGLDILGLTDENHDIIAKALTEKYIEYLENEIL